MKWYDIFILPMIYRKLRRKPPEKTEEKDKPIPEDKLKLYPARNTVQITTPSDMYLKPCVVLRDHKIQFNDLNNKKQTVVITRKPHVNHINLKDLWPTWIGRRTAPKWQRFNTYFVQAEGEMTHDFTYRQVNPDDTPGLTDELKRRYEGVLKLQTMSGKADWGGQVLEGMKKKKHWTEIIPWIVFGVYGVFSLLALLLISGALG